MSDAEILDATARVVARDGPIAFTLADVGAEVGVTAAAILKRFATKRGLLLALADSTRREVASPFRRRPGERALAALVRAVVAQGEGMRTPRALANGLAFLQLDVTDVDFHRLASTFAAGFRARLQALLDEAVREGELRACDTAALARAVEVAFHGSVIAWGLRQEGALEDALRHDAEAALAPFRTTRTSRAARSPRARRPSSA